MRRATEKYVTINGVTFELYDDGRLDNGTIRTGAVYDEIRRVYDRPSQRKIATWTGWCNWAFKCIKNGIDVGIEIVSHNVMMYSITGEVRDLDGTKYELWITRDHNRAFRTHKPMA